MTGIRELESEVDRLEGSDDDEPPTEQDRADAWRKAVESNPRTHDELMERYKRALRGG